MPDMSAVKGIEIYPLASSEGGMTKFYTPQASHETMLVQISPRTIKDLFVYKPQTDQLLVVKGRFVLVTLINRQYQYIALSEDKPVVVKIPSGVMHRAINIDPEPCALVNAVLRHRPTQSRDYIPQRPFAYDIDAAEKELEKHECKISLEKVWKY